MRGQITTLWLGAVLALSAATAAGAQSPGELRDRIDVAEGRVGGLAAELDGSNVELAAITERAQTAAERESSLASALAKGAEREAELSAEVDAAARRLDSARAQLERALDALASRLVAIYKGGTIDEAQVLLDSEGYDDLATRAQFLRRIQDADRRLAVRVRDLRNTVAARLGEFERARDAQAAHNAEITAARDEIAAARAAAEAQAAELRALRARQRTALKGLNSRISSLSERARTAEAAASAQAAAEGAAPSAGPWAIPAGIVMCESGGNYSAVNPSSGAGGAYQILPSTWALYGGSGLPQNASPAEQDRIAAQIWADSGGSAWVCAG